MMITVSQTTIDALKEVHDDLDTNKSIPPSYEKYKNMDALEKILKFFKDEDKVLIRKEMA
jgi:hypothetical protein